ncbi:MAG TPA: ferritin-like domain-containing protein, partial [Kofleriaceae bacterium]|nr:ferritin-like domain-containing protein [Kofleriaceae bacterium]
MRDAINPLPPITTKDQLERYLKEAAILEHQFMAQYLYAAFSLKKDPDERCSDAQFEYVRRWASTIYRVARQEMEHLSIVNSILTAIGG